MSQRPSLRRKSSVRSSTSLTKSRQGSSTVVSAEPSRVQFPVEITETDEGGDVEDSMSLTDMLPAEFPLVPEYKEVLAEGATYYTPSEPIKTVFPDIDEMYLQATKNLEKSCSVERVLPMFRKLHYVLADARTDNETLRAKLRAKENDLQNLAEKLRRDPRVARVILLADRWRKEKAETEAMNADYSLERDEMALAVRDIETQLQHCKEGQKRMADSVEQAKELEARMEKMEEAALRRENNITDLKEHIEKMNLQQEIDAAECERQKGALRAKLAAAPDRNAKQLDQMTRQVAVLMHAKEERKAEMEELQERCKNLVQKLESNKREMAIIKKSLKGSVKRLREMNQAVRLANETNSTLQQKNEKAAANIALLKSERSILERDVQLLNSTVEELKVAKGQLQSVNKSKDEQIIRLKADLKRIKEELNVAKNENRLHEKVQVEYKQKAEKDKCKIRSIDQKLNAKQGKLREAEQKLVKDEESLKVAAMNVANMARNLNYTAEELKKFKRIIDKYDAENHSMTNLLTYLDDVVQDHQRTIRIKDGKNDSLIVQITHLERLLEECMENKIKLRQLNLLAATENDNQREMHNVLTNMLSFTECQLNKAVRTVAQRDENLIILKREQAQRFRDLMNAYKDLTSQKLTINEQVLQLESQKKQMQILAKIIRKAEEDDKAKELLIGKLRHDRDLLGATVIQKNNEIELQSRKMRIYEDVLKRGFHDYNERLKDLNILKIEIRNLRKKLKALEKTDVLNETLRGEVVHTTRLLVQTRDRLQIAETFPATRPHHYTYMMNAEPSEYEKVLKIQKLQRLLIRKTTLVAERDSKIMAQEHALLQLKLLLAKRPVVDCGHQLHSFKAALRDKNREMKALLGELNIVNSDLQESKENQTKIVNELKAAKQEIAKHRRKNTRNDSHLPPVLRPNPNGIGPRTLGGGFVFQGKPGTVKTMMTATRTRQVTETTTIRKL